nr:autotransporter domain-containing protein [Vineibacter terrae]
MGAYWTHLGPSGWYLDAIVQGTIYVVSSDAHRGIPKMKTDGGGVAASLEGGYPFQLGNGGGGRLGHGFPPVQHGLRGQRGPRQGRASGHLG